MSFTSLTVRANGTKIYSSWFNDIRTKLIQVFGGGATGETKFTIADNQSSYADITGMIGVAASYRSYEIKYTIYRTDASAERRETGTLFLHYKAVAETWELVRSSGGDDALNIADSLEVVAATGQVQYKSDSMGGTYSGFITWKIVGTFISEAA